LVGDFVDEAERNHNTATNALPNKGHATTPKGGEESGRDQGHTQPPVQTAKEEL